MATVSRISRRKRSAVLAGLEALSSFKVPKKNVPESLLEPIPIDGSDYTDEIHPQITQSFRFPQLSTYLRVDEAWLVHNRSLEQSFAVARKRFQKSNALNSSEGSFCTGFVVVPSWEKVEKIVKDGFSPGNAQDTWLGKPELGVTVNQCADLSVARTQKRYSWRGDGEPLYLILARWVKSKAYIVAAEAENSDERLEPQPGYACHVSTWSRADPLDPAKLSLERAFQLAQVYLYEFDEDLELLPKPEHILPYAVIKCYWELDTSVAENLDFLSPATGSILVLSPKATRPTIQSAGGILPRPALLPTPSPSLCIGGPRALLSFDETIAASPRPQSGSSIPFNPCFERPLIPLLPDPDASTVPRLKFDRNLHSVKPTPLLSSPPSTAEKTTETKSPAYSINPLIPTSRKLQTSHEVLSRLGEPSTVSCSGASSTGSAEGGRGNTLSPCCLIGVTLLSWGHPESEYSLAVELYTFRRKKFPVFDGILQPVLHVSRVISHAALHYELAGLSPWDTHPPETTGPPVLVSIPRDHEWCLPRLNASTATPLKCDPSPFAGYRGNYFRITLHDKGGNRTEMSQFCHTLNDKSLAGIVHMGCDASSVLFIFPDCQFARSISLPPADSIESNYLHGVLLTPHSLHQYPYGSISCLALQLPTQDTSPSASLTFLSAAPVSAPVDLLSSQRKTTPVPLTDCKLKIPLDAILSSLPDGGKDLLGTALISLLASRPISEDSDSSNSVQYPLTSDSGRLAMNFGPRTDPRLNRNRPFDTHSLASALLSTVAKNPDLFKQSTSLRDTITASESPADLPVNTETPKPKSPSTASLVEGKETRVISAPTSPVVEVKGDKSTGQPKEIPLSSSSPAKIGNPAADVTSDSVDMEVVNDVKAVDIAHSSDMDLNSSVDYYDSPLKYHTPPPMSLYTPFACSLRPCSSQFPFSPHISLLVSDCRDFSYRTPGPCLAPSQFPFAGTSTDVSVVPVHEERQTTSHHEKPDPTAYPTVYRSSPFYSENSIPSHGDSRITYEVHQDRPHHSSILPEKRATAARDPKAEVPAQRPEEYSHVKEQSAPIKQQPTELSQEKFEEQQTESAQVEPANTPDRFQHGLLASPVLILEDISKTHPYFTSGSAKIDESEEGEVVDDEPEDVEDGSDGDHCGGRESDKQVPCGSYDTVSSDISSVSLNVVDEWHTSSADTSFSTSCSRSLRSNHRKRSSRSSRHSPSRSRYTQRSSKSSSSRSPITISSSHNHSSQTLTQSTRNAYCRRVLPARAIQPSVPFNLDDEYKLVDQVHSSTDNSEHSFQGNELSLEDEDMRVPLIHFEQPHPYERSLLPHPQISAAVRLQQSSYEPSMPADNPFTSHSGEFREPLERPRSPSLGEYDVDYRHMGTDNHGSTSRRFRPLPDPYHCVSPSSSSSDYLPKYTIYQPRSDVRDRSRSSRDSKLTGVERSESYSPDAYSPISVTSTSNRVSEYRSSNKIKDLSTRKTKTTVPTRRRTMYHHPPLLPITPSLLVHPRELLGSVESHVLSPTHAASVYGLSSASTSFQPISGLFAQVPTLFPPLWK